MAADAAGDRHLLLRIREGDHPAFAALVKRHGAKYYRLAYRYTARREEAEDVVQAAFLKLWEQPDLWDPARGAQFTTWFYRMVVNLCLDRKKKHGELPLPESFDAADGGPGQEEAAALKQTHALLAARVAALPDRQKTALILCFYEEMSHKEAAEVMGVGVKALESLLSRAKAALKNAMRPYI